MYTSKSGLHTHSRSQIFSCINVPLNPRGSNQHPRLLLSQKALCHHASRRLRLAALTSCSFDSRSETDSVICTPAQTCKETTIPAAWLRKACLGISMTVWLTLLGQAGKRRAAGERGRVWPPAGRILLLTLRQHRSRILLFSVFSFLISQD